ncbi:MAG: hypothetical protein HS129_04960 [Leptospiraceae bacterium]|nr:hypothetical protein [Leptospiraceae bacterium]
MDKDKKEGLMDKMTNFFKSENSKTEDKVDKTSPVVPPSDEKPQTDIDDTVLDELMQKLESNEVQVTEESIKAFCASKNLTDEQCAQIWDVVSSALAKVEDETQPAPTPETEDNPTEDMKKSKGEHEMLEEMTKFMKSVTAYKEDVASQNEAVAALIIENKKLGESVTSLKGEIDFLKSQVTKLSGQPVDVKTPAKTPDDIPITPFQKSRSEIVSILGQGVRARELNLTDVTRYESSGVLSENAQKYLVNVSSQGGNK